MGESRSRFVKPTVAEVQAYCNERRNGIDASHFCDYYESNGWMVGKNHMKDWKAAVRSWETRWKDERRPQEKSSGNVFLEMLEDRL